MMPRWTILVVFPLMLAAQPRGARPWWNKEVAKELNLSDEQTREMTQVESDFRPRMSAVRDEVNKAEAGVTAAFNEDPVDQAKAEAAIERLAAARSELTKAVSQMDLKLRMILTAQQWQQLQQNGRGRWTGRGAGPRHRGPRPPTTNQK
jgi:Spy/CpxP family protein refolding chaperone